MSIVSFDYFDELTEKLNGLNSAYADFYNRLKGTAATDSLNDWVLREEYTQYTERIEKAEAIKGKIVSTIYELAATKKDYEKHAAAGAASGNHAGMESQTYTSPILFGAMAGSVERYKEYKTYQFARVEGKSFSQDYNDLPSFMSSSTYKSAWTKAGFGEISNYGLYFDTLLGGKLGAVDKFTYEIIDESLAGVLDSMTPPEQIKDYPGTVKYLGETLGIDNPKGWFSKLKDVISYLLALNKEKLKGEGLSDDDIADLLKDERVQELLDAIPPERQEMFEKILGRTLNLKDLSTGAKILKYSDPLAKGIVSMFCNYDQQIRTLDAMKTAMISAGYANGGPVLERIDHLRVLYDNKFLRFMDDCSETFKDFAIGKITDFGIDKISEHVPVIGNVAKGLEFIDHTADIAFHTEIEATKTLSGIMVYEEALTKSYENYVELMNNKIASPEEMAMADQVYELLVATKKTEYGAMMDLMQKNMDEYAVEIKTIERSGLYASDLRQDFEDVKKQYRQCQEKYRELANCPYENSYCIPEV